MSREAQSFDVKRAEVEFHEFASLGEPERAVAVHAEENTRRGQRRWRLQPAVVGGPRGPVSGRARGYH
jgi:hypothetical protein